MAGDSSALNVILTANFKRLEKDLNKAGLVADKAVNDIEDKFSKAKLRLNTQDLFKASFAGNLAAGAVKSIAEQIARIPEMVAEANKAIADIGRTSSRTGLSTGRVQEIQYAASQGGVDSSTTLSGLDAVAKKIDEIAHGGENSLGKLFSDNNAKVTDLNSALLTTANLMKGASNAFEKEKIAEAVGLTKEWVPVLENGAAAFDKVAGGASAAGAVIDDEIIKKAAQFQRDWEKAVADFATVAKANLGPFLKMLTDAVGLAAKLLSIVGQRLDASAANALTAAGVPTDASQMPSLAFLDRMVEKAKSQGIELNDEFRRMYDARKKFEEDMAKAGPAQPLTVRPKGTTNVSSLYSTPKGGGSSGTSEEDQRFNQVERYIAQLEKTGRVLQAEKDSIGLSNAERAKAIELARIGTVTDEGQLDRLKKQIDENEQLRQAIEKAKMAQRGMNDAANFAGEQLLNAFDTLLDGGKIEDAINGITRALMKAALQAAILGQGPLANLFGSASTTGGPGGLIGSILGAFVGARASGGPVQAGKTYLVGENGPEMVRFGKNGSVMPNGVIGGRGGGGSAPVIVNVNDNNNSEISASETQGPGGARQIEIMIEAAVTKSIAKNGGIAQALQGRYGLNRSGGRR